MLRSGIRRLSPREGVQPIQCSGGGDEGGGKRKAEGRWRGGERGESGQVNTNTQRHRPNNHVSSLAWRLFSNEVVRTAADNLDSKSADLQFCL